MFLVDRMYLVLRERRAFPASVKQIFELRPTVLDVNWMFVVSGILLQWVPEARKRLIVKTFLHFLRRVNMNITLSIRGYYSRSLMKRLPENKLPENCYLSLPVTGWYWQLVDTARRERCFWTLPVTRNNGFYRHRTISPGTSIEK